MGSSDIEKNAAENVFNAVVRPAATSTLKEGEESAEFWDSLGGQGEYSKVKESMQAAKVFGGALGPAPNTRRTCWGCHSSRYSHLQLKTTVSWDHPCSPFSSTKPCRSLDRSWVRGISSALSSRSSTLQHKAGQVTLASNAI